MSFSFNPFTCSFDAVGLLGVGSFSSTPTAEGLVVSGTNVKLTAADATHPGGVSISTQSFAGVKTFSSVVKADGGLDVTATGGTDTLSIGVTNADVINIGNSGATVNVQGTTFYQNVTNLQVSDKLITVNKGGSAASGTGSGIEIEENSVITGYASTSSNRNSWELKAPNTAGIAVITPGASGITLDQSSHNPVTIGTANGLSLATQALSLTVASAGVTGALSGTDWSTFNNKQAALTIGNLTDAGTDGIVVTGGTGAVIGSGTSIAQHVADSTHNGYLSSTDWSTFNNKQSTVSFSSVGSTPSAAGGGISAGVITLQPADGSNPGVVSTTTQTFAGTKTFSSTITGSTTGNLLKASGDINETSFSAANNTAVAANVTSLAFANATVRAFEALVSVYVNATSSLYETFMLYGIQKGSSWEMSQTSVGDVSGFVFTITTAGQVQYVNSNYTGFSAATLKFRAVTVSV